MVLSFVPFQWVIPGMGALALFGGSHKRAGNIVSTSKGDFLMSCDDSKEGAELKAVISGLPLPPLNSPRSYQSVWREECLLADRQISLFFENKENDSTWKEKVSFWADVMIDRGLQVLADTQDERIHYYAAIGTLRFTRFRRSRLEQVCTQLRAVFPQELPQHVKKRITWIEQSLDAKVKTKEGAKI